MHRTEELAPEIAQILEMGLPAFDTYIEVIMAHRGDFHRRYFVRVSGLSAHEESPWRPHRTATRQERATPLYS